MSMIMPVLTFCQQVTKSHKPTDLPVGALKKKNRLSNRKDNLIDKF